jgi:hypothetical protein
MVFTHRSPTDREVGGSGEPGPPDPYGPFLLTSLIPNAKGLPYNLISLGSCDTIHFAEMSNGGLSVSMFQRSTDVIHCMTAGAQNLETAQRGNRIGVVVIPLFVAVGRRWEGAAPSASPVVLFDGVAADRFPRRSSFKELMGADSPEWFRYEGGVEHSIQSCASSG